MTVAFRQEHGTVMQLGQGAHTSSSVCTSSAVSSRTSELLNRKRFMDLALHADLIDLESLWKKKRHHQHAAGKLKVLAWKEVASTAHCAPFFYLLPHE